MRRTTLAGEPRWVGWISAAFWSSLVILEVAAGFALGVCIVRRLG